jgi:hypothetical protein
MSTISKNPSGGTVTKTSGKTAKIIVVSLVLVTFVFVAKIAFAESEDSRGWFGHMWEGGTTNNEIYGLMTKKHDALAKGDYDTALKIQKELWQKAGSGSNAFSFGQRGGFGMMGGKGQGRFNCPMWGGGFGSGSAAEE